MAVNDGNVRKIKVESVFPGEYFISKCILVTNPSGHVKVGAVTEGTDTIALMGLDVLEEPYLNGNTYPIPTELHGITDQEYCITLDNGYTIQSIVLNSRDHLIDILKSANNVNASFANTDAAIPVSESLEEGWPTDDGLRYTGTPVEDLDGVTNPTPGMIISYLMNTIDCYTNRRNINPSDMEMVNTAIEIATAALKVFTDNPDILYFGGNLDELREMIRDQDITMLRSVLTLYSISECSPVDISPVYFLRHKLKEAEAQKAHDAATDAPEAASILGGRVKKFKIGVSTAFAIGAAVGVAGYGLFALLRDNHDDVTIID